MNVRETTAVIELVLYNDRDISEELMRDFYGGITNVILNDEGGHALECQCMDSSVTSLILMDKQTEEEDQLIKEIGDKKFIYKKSPNWEIHFDSLVQLDADQENIYYVVEFQNIIYLYNGIRRKSIIDKTITSLRSLKEYLDKHYPAYKILERL